MAKPKKKAAKPKPQVKAKPKVKRVKKLVASSKIVAAAKKSAARAARGAPIRRKAAAPKKPLARDPDLFVLHGFHTSMPSNKVGLMLAMSDVPWEFKHIDLRAAAQRRPEYLALSRYGRVPALEHRGQHLCESNAILVYLASVTGKFAPRNETERMRVQEWLFWETDRLAAGVGQTRAFTRFIPQHEEVVKFTRRRGEAALGELDRHLGTSKFIAGPAPTIADVAVFPWIATADEGGFDIARWPNVRAWAERMLAQPGAAHPYTIMPKEDRPATA